MSVAELPETVQEALGPVAAKDLLDWVEAKLRTLSPEVQISAFVARQKVNVLVLERISNLLLAGDPALSQRADGRWVWRVPVDLTFPSHGRVGCVGELDIDAHHGEVFYDEASLARMANEAQRLKEKVE